MALLKVMAFLSAFLMFQIELIVAKLFLPYYGGSFLVWGACMVFFQAVLLAGYVFAHVFLQRLDLSRYLKVHAGLVFAPLLFFPLSHLRLTFHPYPLPLVLDVFWRLTVTIGPVFFVLSTMSLLTQSWLGVSSLKEADNPYALYAVSNFGSLAGLLTYPFIFERYFGNTEQLQIWRMLYVVLVFGNLLAWRIILLPARGHVPSFRDGAPSALPGKPTVEGGSSQGKPRINAPLWRWLCLGAAGVVMFLSVTNIITYEVAPVPLLWVIPLGLYLLAFILNFKRNPWCPPWIVRGISPILGSAAMMYFLQQKHFLPVIAVIGTLCVFLFFICMYIQHELIASKPGSREDMTLFYVAISLGGFLGGILTSWIIPLVSNTLIEYPVGILLAALAAPAGQSSFVRSMGGIFLAGAAFMLWPVLVKDYHIWSFVLLWLMVWSAFFALSADKMSLVAVLAAVVLATPFLESLWRGVVFIAKKRNYYGIYEVYNNASGLRALIHGTTLHGVEFMDPAKRHIPLGYYSPVSAIGSLLIADTFQAKRVGVVGLGTGALAMYSKPDCPVDYYELDADVQKLASKYFWYLAEAPGEVHVILGDARLSLAQAPDGAYDLLVIDAFSGDSIPIHLVNEDVLAEYRRKLTAKGAVVFHITNRYLNLEPVLAKMAQDSKAYVAIKDVGDQGLNMRAVYCLLTWDQDRFLTLITRQDWDPLDVDPKYLGRSWTDDYSTILPIINLRELAASLKSFKPLAW